MNPINDKTPAAHGHFLDGLHLPAGPTRFWLVRHAIVREDARRKLYGARDVPLCPHNLEAQKAYYASLASRLPRDAIWYSSPLSRAVHTAQAIFDNGAGPKAITVEPRFIEQSLGDWHDTLHDGIGSLLQEAPHPFWSLSATERPPEGESMLDVCARVGHALNDLALRHEGEDIVVVSHGGAIRAAIAHALKLHPDTALNFCVQNLSLTIIERVAEDWRLVTANEMQNVTNDLDSANAPAIERWQNA